MTAAKEKKKTYDEIDTIFGVMPTGIGFNNDEGDMNSVAFVLNIVGEAVFSVHHEPNPNHSLQIR